MPVRVVAASDRRQAHTAEPIQRMALRAVVQGEPGLRQRPCDVAGERGQRVVGRQWAAVGVGQPGHRLREFRSLGNRSERAEVRRLVAQAVVPRRSLAGSAGVGRLA